MRRTGYLFRLLSLPILGILVAFSFTGPGCTRVKRASVAPLEAEVDAYVHPFLEARGFSGTILMASGDRILSGEF